VVISCWLEVADEGTKYWALHHKSTSFITHL